MDRQTNRKSLIVISFVDYSISYPVEITYLEKSINISSSKNGKLK